jgi:hypothetical protein
VKHKNVLHNPDLCWCKGAHVDERPGGADEHGGEVAPAHRLRTCRRCQSGRHLQVRPVTLHMLDWNHLLINLKSTYFLLKKRGKCDRNKGNSGIFLVILLMYVIQHCFLCRPSDSTVSEDAGI